MTSLKRLFALAGLSLLAACGGGGGGSSDSGGTPRPTALATASPETAEFGATFTLDGGKSTSPRSGATLSYHWTLATRPAGSQATLSNAAHAQPSFVADLPGSYQATLVVADGTAESTPATVAVSATNAVPVAIAPSTHSVLIGTHTALDGSASLAPTGTDPAGLRYRWTLASRPDGSAAELSRADTAQASLFADIQGSYTATLVVSHGDKDSAPLTVTILAGLANVKPIADAGGPYTVVRGQTLVLDGSKSHDPDGGTLSYRWSLLEPPLQDGTSIAQTTRTVLNGSALRVETAIRDADKAKASITPDMAGTFTVYLFVYDGKAVSDITSTTVTVAAPADAPNTPPVASLYPSPAFAFFQPTYTNEWELNNPYTYYGAGSSWDADGNATTLTARRRWISSPPGFTQPDLNASSRVRFVPNIAGTYQVEIIVNDGQADSAPYVHTLQALTGARSASIRLLTVDNKTIGTGTSAWFDATQGATAANQQVNYHWHLLDRPDGSTATLTPADGTREDGVTLKNARAEVKTDKPGVYRVLMVTSDTDGNYAQNVFQGVVVAKTDNTAPTVEGLAILSLKADAGNDNLNVDAGDQPYVVDGPPLSLNATNVVDADLDALYYLWTSTQPAGGTLPRGAERTWFELGTPTLPGAYEATFVASDGIAYSAPLTLRFNAVARANYPSLLLEDLLAAYPFNSRDGHDSDYQAAAPSQRTFPYSVGESSSFSLMSHETQAGDNLVKTFRLTAFDRDYTLANVGVAASINEDVPGYTAKIVGIASGQKVRKGESVEFSLVLTAASPVERTNEQKNRMPNAVEGMSYTFEIVERPGWTFQYRPYLN